MQEFRNLDFFPLHGIFDYNQTFQGKRGKNEEHQSLLSNQYQSQVCVRKNKKERTEVWIL